MADEWWKSDAKVSPSEEWWAEDTVVAGPKRGSPLERLTSDYSNEFERGGLARLAREYPATSLMGGDSFFENPENTVLGFGILEGGGLDRLLGAVGINAGTVRDDERRAAIAAEGARRQAFEELSAVDPWNAYDRLSDRLLHGGAALGGTIAGAASSPENWVGWGRTALARIASTAVTNAGIDAAYQVDDISDGLQTDYNLAQTLVAGGFGALFGASGELVRTAAPSVWRALVEPRGKAAGPSESPSPVTPPDNSRVVESTETGAVWENPDGSLEGEVVAGTKPEAPKTAPEAATGTPAETAAAATGANPQAAAQAAAPAQAGAQAAPGSGAAATPPPPDFNIVQPIAKTGLLPSIAKAIRDNELPGLVGDWIVKGYTAVFDRTHPLYRVQMRAVDALEEATGTPFDVLPEDNPYLQARLLPDVFTAGHQDLLHGVHGYKSLTPEGPALADAVKAVLAREVREGEAPATALQRFNEYLAAKRVSGEWDRRAAGKLDKDPASKSKAEADAFIAHVDAEYPHYADAATMVSDFANLTLRKLKDAGHLSQEAFDQISAERSFYAPLRRVMDDAVKLRGSGADGSSSAVRVMKGSDRDIIAPLDALVQHTYAINRRIRNNDLNRSLVRLVERADAAMRAATGDAEASTGILAKVKKPTKPVQVSKDELKSMSNRNAPDDMLDALFDDDGGTIYRPGEINDKGRPIIYVWENGERTAYEVTDAKWGKEVFEVLNGMSEAQADLFVDVVAAPTWFLTRTITKDPAFFLANYIRDQLSAWTLTGDGFVPGEGLGGIYDNFANTDVARRYNVVGGIAGGVNTSMMSQVSRQFETEKLAQGGMRARYLSSLGGFLELTEVSETGTRMRVFDRAFNRAKKTGMDDWNAALEAGLTSRDLIDFGLHGSKLAAVRRLIPFLNAQLQGLRKSGIVLVGDPVQAGGKALRDVLAPLFNAKPGVGLRASEKAALKLAFQAWTKVSAAAVLGLGLAAIYAGDPRYQAVSAQTRATHWVIPNGDDVFKIPKHFELAFLSNVLERAYEATYFDDPTAWDKLWKGLGEMFMPRAEIPLLTTAAEVAANKDFQTGMPIVPREREDLDPELQFTTWTSAFARDLGKQMGWSPAQIDHVLSGLTGPFSAYLRTFGEWSDPDRPAMQMADYPIARRFVSRWQRGAQDKADFWERVGAITRDLKSVQEYEEAVGPVAAQDRLKKADESARLYVLTQQGDTAIRRLHPMTRAEVVAREASRMIGEINGARPKDEGEPLVPMGPQAKAILEDALERLAVAEMHNAMVLSRQPGFVRRPLMPRDDIWAEVEAASPEAAAELERRLGAGRDRAYSYDAIMEIWPQVEARLRARESAEDLRDLAREAQGRSQWSRRRSREETAEDADLRF